MRTAAGNAFSVFLSETGFSSESNLKNCGAISVRVIGRGRAVGLFPAFVFEGGGEFPPDAGVGPGHLAFDQQLQRVLQIAQRAGLSSVV